MNFYLEALQDEHLLLKNVLETYCTQAKEIAAKIRKASRHSLTKNTNIANTD